MNRKIDQGKAMGQSIGLMLCDVDQWNEYTQQGCHQFEDFKMLSQIVNGFVELMMCLVIEEKRHS